MRFQKGQSGNPAGKPVGARTAKLVEREREIAASGLTPLEHMLKVLRNPETSEERKDDMAKAAAPYVHPKLAQVQYEDKTPKGPPIDLRALSEEQLFALEDIANALIQKRQEQAPRIVARTDDED